MIVRRLMNAHHQSTTLGLYCYSYAAITAILLLLHYYYYIYHTRHFLRHTSSEHELCYKPVGICTLKID